MADRDRTIDLLAQRFSEIAATHRSNSEDPRPAPTASAAELRARFDVGLPDSGRDILEIINRLADAAQPGLIGNTGPGFFGWVMGASHPAGVAAEWLTSIWGQNSAIYATSPAAAVAEDVAAQWLLDLLRLPTEAAVGFSTGATMASFTCLCAARNDVLRRHGYDIDGDGLFGAPPISVFVGKEAHATILSALRYLGFGQKSIVTIATDSEGRMQANDLEAKLAIASGPKIIIAQAGHINSGAFDPFAEITSLAKRHDAWLHVDGAFGLWTRAVPELANQCAKVEDADSWSVDGHKWLQVPYDSGFAIVRDAGALKRAMDTTASYIRNHPEAGRNPTEYGPELSRRARGFAVWAVIQALGRQGIAELVLTHCRLASHLKNVLVDEPGIEILNDVTLNQLALSFCDTTTARDADALTQRVIAEIRRENVSFVEGADWKGRHIMRVSIISQETRREHIDRLARSIVDAWQKVRGECGKGDLDRPDTGRQQNIAASVD